MISDEEEVKLYYSICKIARVCRKYFYDRKYVPRDFWSLDKVVESISSASYDLEKQFNKFKKN